ncbi:MAG: hypothetical protein GX552_13000, partial [Chloroflexi bacterium]|nr:hypothetical protein [Chloroflexota bacterium]
LIPEKTLRIHTAPLRQWEYDLRQRIYAWEHFDDDQVIDDTFAVGHTYTHTGWGVEPAYTRSDTERGSYVWDAPIKTLDDLDKLHYPEVIVDWETTQRHLELAQDLFGDILRVTLHSSFWWSLGLMNTWAMLRGLERLMMDMVEHPEWMHRVCRFLTDGQLHLLDNLQAQGLLSLNNGNHYVGSGHFGFTEQLPAPGYQPGHVRTQDMWGFTEGQEITGVSPQMHWEFALQYEAAIHQRFGLTYYGCCEPLDFKFDYVKRLPHLHAVSISPWCNRAIAAEALQDKYIYSWKPHPAHLAAVQFDGEYVRQYIRETLEIARGCCVEMALKDTHTCNNQPQRFDEWTRIAQQESQRAASKS